MTIPQGVSMLITIKDCVRLGYCTKGVKIYLQNCGVDFKEFLRKGVDSERLPKDPCVLKIIEMKRGK